MASSERRRAQLRARAATAARARGDGPRLPPPAPFVAVGGVLALAACAVLAWLVVVSYRGGSLARTMPFLAESMPRAAVPAILLLIGGSLLFLGVMFRRAAWQLRMGVLGGGGTTTLRLRPAGVLARIGWGVLALACYVALVPVPAFAPGAAHASLDFWTLAVVYGFIAAGFVGLVVIGVVRAAAYALPAPARVSRGERRAWRAVSVQWRIEYWLGFASGGFFGMLPLAHVRTPHGAPLDEDTASVLLAIAIACGVVGCLLALASRRSGYEQGVSESII